MLESVAYNSRRYAHSTYLSHLLERNLFEAVKRHLEVHEGELVLEVGCNRGAIVKRIQEIGVRAYGVDINREAIADGVCEGLQVMNATNLEFPNAMFHKIYSLHTIEHIPDVKGTLAEMERVLKPGGKLLLTYPIEPGFLRGFSCLYHAVAVYKNPLLVKKIHVHSFNPEKIKRLIEHTTLFHTRTLLFAVPLYPHQYLTVLQKVE